MSCTQKVIDHGYLKKLNDLKNHKQYFAKVGFPEEGEVKTTEPGIDTMSELATIAASHEFGSPAHNIPQRCFLSAAFDETKEARKALEARLWKQIMNNELTLGVGVGRLGEFMVGKVKNKIRSGEFAPLKQATIDRKGSSKPLIDTAQMLNSVQYVVVQEKPNESV